MEFAIDCKDLGVRFKKFREKKRMLRWTIINLMRERKSIDYFWALKDVSFSIKPGETYGIIGGNGSGKSTLLKLLSGIIKADKGSLKVQGKISALLELGAGFQADLTGRENIYLNGSILGLSRDEISRRLDEIIRFSELETFVDTPVKHYSSGMYMRLGFAIAVNVDPEILLIDEVLAVGDQSFQAKCIERIQDFKRKGKTIVFVSHDLNTVSKLCNRAIWLNNGKVAARGTTQRVIDFYQETMQKEHTERLEENHKLVEEEIRERWGSREVEITRVEFYDKDGKKERSFRTGDSFKVKISFHAHRKISKPVFGIAIHRSDGTHVNGPNTKFSNVNIHSIKGRGSVWYEIEKLMLLPGTFYFSAAIYNFKCDHPFDHHDQLYPFKIVPGCSDEEYGVFWLPSVWRIELDE